LIITIKLKTFVTIYRNSLYSIITITYLLVEKYFYYHKINIIKYILPYYRNILNNY
jgi:hypothetical protein